MNLATGPLLGRIGAAVLTQAVLSYVSVIEENLQVSPSRPPSSSRASHLLRGVTHARIPLQRQRLTVSRDTEKRFPIVHRVSL